MLHYGTFCFPFCHYEVFLSNFIYVCFCTFVSLIDSSSDHRVRHVKMAIPPKFDSNMPLAIVTGGSEHSFLSKEDDDEPREEEKDSLVQAIGPHLSRVMQLGTAKHVHAAEEVEHAEEPCVSVVAQAESETVYSLLMFLSGLLGILIKMIPLSQEKTSRSSAPPTPSAPTPDPSSSKNTGNMQVIYHSSVFQSSLKEGLAVITLILSRF